MIHTNIGTKTQTDIQILGQIDDFFSKFSIATSLHRLVSENVMDIVSVH